MGIFGIFTYFARIDKDGSGYLEIDEIEGKTRFTINGF